MSLAKAGEIFAHYVIIIIKRRSPPHEIISDEMEKNFGKIENFWGLGSIALVKFEKILQAAAAVERGELPGYGFIRAFTYIKEGRSKLSHPVREELEANGIHIANIDPEHGKIAVRTAIISATYESTQKFDTSQATLEGTPSSHIISTAEASADDFLHSLSKDAVVKWVQEKLAENGGRILISSLGIKLKDAPFDMERMFNGMSLTHILQELMIEPGLAVIVGPDPAKVLVATKTSHYRLKDRILDRWAPEPLPENVRLGAPPQDADGTDRQPPREMTSDSYRGRTVKRSRESRRRSRSRSREISPPRRSRNRSREISPPRRSRNDHHPVRVYSKKFDLEVEYNSDMAHHYLVHHMPLHNAGRKGECGVECEDFRYFRNPFFLGGGILISLDKKNFNVTSHHCAFIQNTELYDMICPICHYCAYIEKGTIRKCPTECPCRGWERSYISQEFYDHIEKYHRRCFYR